MLPPPMRWAYRRAEKRRSTLLLVSLASLALVTMYRWRTDRPLAERWQSEAAAVESRGAGACAHCSPWQRAALADQLSGPLLRVQLGAALADGSLSTHCGRLLRLAGTQHVCLDEDLLAPRGRCLVYSTSADVSLAPETELAVQFGCEVHVFSGSPPPPPRLAGRLRANVTRHAQRLTGGAAATSGSSWSGSGHAQSRTLDELSTLLGHGGRHIDYLRLDGGAGAWAALQQQLSVTHGGGAALDRVSQLSVPVRPAAAEDSARLQLRALTALSAAGLRLAHAADVTSVSSATSAAADRGGGPVFETLWVRWEEPAAPCGLQGKAAAGLPCCDRVRGMCDGM